MKRGFLCFWFFIIMLGAVSTVPAKGAKETKPAPVNDTWTFCITEFDTSALPQGRAVIGQMIMQYIIENVRTIETRLWTSREAAYYDNAAQFKAANEAAKALRDKQTERDKLIFAGEKERKYKQNLKKVDAEIAVLRANLEKAENTPILIETSPSVKFTEDNNKKIFPEPPKQGQEYYFCTGQKADAFLTGKITEYFERIYVEISLWSLYARKITYTDTVIFSPQDIKEGTTELADKLFDHISGFLPAWIKVKASPPGAVIVINDYVAGEGETELIDFTPGTVSVTAFAEDHRTFQADVELREGEQTEVSIELIHVPVTEFDVSLKDGQKPSSTLPADTTSENEAALYDGALYVGETPLKLSGPLDQQRSLSVETPDGRVAQTVFHVSNAPIVFDPKIPPPPDRVEIARKKFYSAYGRFWIALPLAILSIGLNNTITSVYNATGDPDIGKQQQAVYWTSMGLNVIMGLCLAESFYRIGRYVWEANKESNILVKKAPEPEIEAASSTEDAAESSAEDAAESPAGLSETEDAMEDPDGFSETEDAGTSGTNEPAAENKSGAQNNEAARS
ncbi:MAG: PEGA domain-containing protein [Spirochaetaceae bacterium]|nr:PEGA domain-containing protein [Spirochaetaceae bacterium]